MIDLRSDTVTKPTQEMRAAMARAEVGDDVYGDDPTVRKLEERTAEMLGKESAVFMPTGTMSNQVALRTHTEAGDEILADINAHVVTSEGGAPAGLSGILVRPLLGKHGIFTASDVLGAVRVPHPFYPRSLPAPTKLVCLENTHNGGGGTIWPLDRLREVAQAARSRGLALHLDGARLWNASVATGIPESEYAAAVDSVSVCFSKGLGAPVGSALAGRRAFIERARRFRQMFGGGLRQAGVLAAAALHALQHHRSELVEDHQKASALAAGLAGLRDIELDTNLVQTNILRFRVTSMTAAELVERCYENGVHMLPSGEDRVRAVLHRDIRRSDVAKALSILEKALSGERRSSTLH
ncbi:MAG TPA: GntG family PLP-dependent aldolase [Vicinamibacteria bacterium]|nr:GntG family PLP-dependent aldolase [Vicinamibacteria bacterium]